MASWRDILAGLTGRRGEQAPPVELPHVPTSAELVAAVDRIPAEIEGKVPPIVSARVARIVATVRDTIPRLDQLGAGSQDAHSVMATATSYLPEALNAYLRLPRSFADRRPVQGGKTSLMVLVDQLDLLAVTMDGIFDAVCRSDADALIAHGRFLAEKFGRGSLDVGQLGGGQLGGGQLGAGPVADGQLGGGPVGGGDAGGTVPR